MKQLFGWADMDQFKDSSPYKKFGLIRVVDSKQGQKFRPVLITLGEKDQTMREFKKILFRK